MSDEVVSCMSSGGAVGGAGGGQTPPPPPKPLLLYDSMGKARQLASLENISPLTKKQVLQN